MAKGAGVADVGVDVAAGDANAGRGKLPGKKGKSKGGKLWGQAVGAVMAKGFAREQVGAELFDACVAEVVKGMKKGQGKGPGGVRDAQAAEKFKLTRAAVGAGGVIGHEGHALPQRMFSL